MIYRNGLLRSTVLYKIEIRDKTSNALLYIDSKDFVEDGLGNYTAEVFEWTKQVITDFDVSEYGPDDYVNYTATLIRCVDDV
jgi:hypothetical protein